MESNLRLFYFDRKTLADLAAGLRRDYARAKPFPHVVMDDFLPEDVATRVLDEFPVPTEIKWHAYSASQESKLACEDETQMGKFTRHIISQFNSSLFVSFLEEPTGGDALIADPHLRGGGLHQIRRVAS